MENINNWISDNTTMFWSLDIAVTAVMLLVSVLILVVTIMVNKNSFVIKMTILAITGLCFEIGYLCLVDKEDEEPLLRWGTFLSA